MDKSNRSCHDGKLCDWIFVCVFFIIIALTEKKLILTRLYSQLLVAIYVAKND